MGELYPPTTADYNSGEIRQLWKAIERLQAEVASLTREQNDVRIKLENQRTAIKMIDY